MSGVTFKELISSFLVDKKCAIFYMARATGLYGDIRSRYLCNKYTQLVRRLTVHSLVLL